MKNLFENLKKRNRAALILYVSCGDPSIEFSEKRYISIGVLQLKRREYDKFCKQHSI